MKNSMIGVHGLLVLGFLATVSSDSHAQEIKGIRIDQARPAPNIPVAIQIDFDLANVQNPYCGLEISFGDGNTQTVRAGLNGAQDFPLRLTHSYANPGQYLVKAEGKALVRGLKSASACQGSVSQQQLTIIDEAAEKAAEKAREDVARKERELAAREIELKRLEEKIEREKHEQALKERQLREHELTRKRREMEQKEHQAQQKDSPRDTRTSPIPSTPSPAPTANRRTIDGF